MSAVHYWLIPIISCIFGVVGSLGIFILATLSEVKHLRDKQESGCSFLKASRVSEVKHLRDKQESSLEVKNEKAKKYNSQYLAELSREINSHLDNQKSAGDTVSPEKNERKLSSLTPKHREEIACIIVNEIYERGSIALVTGILGDAGEIVLEKVTSQKSINPDDITRFFSSLDLKIIRGVFSSIARMDSRSLFDIMLASINREYHDKVLSQNEKGTDIETWHERVNSAINGLTENMASAINELTERMACYDKEKELEDAAEKEECTESESKLESSISSLINQSTEYIDYYDKQLKVAKATGDKYRKKFFSGELKRCIKRRKYYIKLKDKNF